MVHICECFPARIRRALAELPETLDETYERTLRRINKANWDIAHRMFQFVSVASRPLRVKELAELLAFDFEAGSIPDFYEDWRVEDPADAVLSTCSTLLAIVDDKASPVIQFSHFSVKEFLTSTRFAEATDAVSRFQVSMTPAHTLVAQACLGILLHLDKDITYGMMENLPLADYAGKHWADHALFEDVSQNVEDGMKQLFDPDKPHLAICAWIHDSPFPWWAREQDETPQPLPEAPLHYAASWGLHPVIEFLIIEHSQDVCSRYSYNFTPLHSASVYGHVKVACMLIEHGSDPTAQNENGDTPLHLASNMGEVDVARMLIEHGSDPTAQDNDGDTPLHLASYMGRVDVARMLIERGSDLTAQDKYGNTPLHEASGMGEVDVARMLIERRSDLTAQDKKGNTPLHLASDPPIWLRRPQERAEVSQMLLVHGADVNARNKDGFTPIALASKHGLTEVVDVLVQHGADSRGSV